MPLRCLLFSSNEEMCQPIRQVLTDLGIEGEYCPNAVDAVERVTTQLFQIVITDWDDQPEAAFLLKTAREQKATQRPLTLAIVSDSARLPEALQAGANSVLVQPISTEQVRDTMSTACELLRAKQPPAAPQPAATARQSEAPETAARAASASAGAVSSPQPAPANSPQEKNFRAGEFLQSSGSAPGAQFDTECEVQKSLEQAAAAEVDALTELEPMASAVVEASAAEPAEPQVEPREPLTGWVALQARLMKSAPPAPPDPTPGNGLLSYGETHGETPRQTAGETPSYGVESASPNEGKQPAVKQSQREAESEAALFSYMSGEANSDADRAESVPPKRSKIFVLCAVMAVCAILAAIPRTRRSLQFVYRNAVHVGGNWLNPQPVAVPPAVTQHESFGQEGDDYKFPVAANIPDATTDPSQIRVLPVVDPTAKPVKGNDASSAQGTASESAPVDQNQSGGTSENGQPQAVPGDSTSMGEVAGGAAVASSDGMAPAAQVPANPSIPQAAPPEQQPPPIAQPVQIAPPPHAVSPGSNGAIPSSLKSQIASMTPEASGAKPVEAAMSSIEPVSLPESAVRDLLADPVDPAYPDAAKSGGQRGSVVLQVLIGRDGAVQDAKFMQGSLVFARAAIDAVKQWRFKPYTMNGRAVSVQSLITLNFKPPG
jgi:TonB family protein